MGMAELLPYIKNMSMKDLVAAAKVTTDQERTRLNSLGYHIGYTAEEWRHTFPEIDVGKIYYNKGLDSTFYYDQTENILFPIQLFGMVTLQPKEKFADGILKRAEILKTQLRDGNYVSLLLGLQDRMRMEMLDILIKQHPSETMYALFCDFYPSSDYGCNALSINAIKRLRSLKSESQTKKTQDLLKEYPDSVILYRGQGSQSARWEQAVSWTTDINIANFFASRLESEYGEIHIAEADKKDIIEFFDNEKECIVLPENIRRTDMIPVWGRDLLEEQLPQIAHEYQHYRELTMNGVNFTIDDLEHGKLHTFRVILNCLLLANLKKVSPKEREILCAAAVFHDTRRQNNGEDTAHGEAAAKYFRKFAEEHPDSVAYHKVTEQLIQYHSLPDSYGRKAVAEENQHLYDIFKDADALDRVRFGIYALDLHQLRTKEAKSMTIIAGQLVRNIRMPEPTLEQGMELT